MSELLTSELAQLLFSLIVISALVVLISKRFKLSRRYERSTKSERPLNDWSALDRGIDPTITDIEGEQKL